MPGTFPTSIRSPTPPSTSRGSTNSFQTATSHQATVNAEWTSFSVHDAQELQSRLDANYSKLKWSYDEANRKPPSPTRQMSTCSSDGAGGGATLHLDVGAQVKEIWSYERVNSAMQAQLQYASSLGLSVGSVNDLYKSPKDRT